MHRFASLFLTLTTCAGALGCADTIAGSSAMLKTDLPQTLLGGFDGMYFPIVGDLDGDGLGDLIAADTRGSSAEITYTFAGAIDEVTYTSPPVDVRVFYGVPGGFGLRLSPQDADAIFTLRAGEQVDRIDAVDLDGDGAAELTILAPLAYPRDPSPGGVYVLAGGPRRAGTAELASIADRADAPTHTAHLSSRRPTPLDLDGQPGREYITNSANDEGFDAGSIEIRSVEDGGLRATLVAREHEMLRVLGVLDLDADGSNDVVCEYGLLDTDGSGWSEQGMGVFYGPFVGDRSLGDAATETAPGEAELYSGVVGNYVGDAHDDLLLLRPDRTLHALRGGPREPTQDLAGALVAVEALAAFVDAEMEYGPWLSGCPDQDDDGFDEVMAAVGHRVVLVTMAGTAINELELSYSDGTAIYTYYGSNLADLDGDGSLDFVMGTGADPNDVGWLVHVVYGFGG